MLKVLIVDDDIFAYTNLTELINWETVGFALCTAAANGIEAIKIIAAETPDIVITDMSMPGMNGIALIEYIDAHYPGIKIIALSAYDEFEYVKHSLKMGAVDYILKHTLTAEVLLNVLRPLKDSIIDQRREAKANQKIEEQIQTGKSVLRQKFIQLWLREGIKEKAAIEQKIEDLNLELDSKNLVVVAGDIDDYAVLKGKFSAAELHNLLQSFTDMAAEILKDSGKSLISALEEGKFVIIFSFDDLHSEQSIHNCVFTAILRIKSTMKRYLNITACFGIGGICTDAVNADQYYWKAEKLLAKKFYEGKDRVFHDLPVVRVNSTTPVIGIKEEKNILQLIKSLEQEKLGSYINDIFGKIQQYQPDPDLTKMIFVTLINIANKIALDSGIDSSLIYGNISDPYEQVKQFDTINEVKEWIIAIYAKIINVLESFCLNPEYDGVTKTAIEYIYRNYKADISLNDIADHIGVNSSYLSRKFKKDCGKGVIEYLNMIRIGQAKLLMESGAKRVKQIADEVGFNNYNYFFKVFKDSQGMTPLEYEKSCRG
jgi:Response regulator containing CheY-like receiver domain and AraC-type DNA-binding domain